MVWLSCNEQKKNHSFNPLTPGNETSQILLCLTPDDFTCQGGGGGGVDVSGINGFTTTTST